MSVEEKANSTEVKFQCAVDHRAGYLHITFTEPVTHIAFNKEQALDFLKTLQMNTEKL